MKKRFKSVLVVALALIIGGNTVTANAAEVSQVKKVEEAISQNIIGEISNADKEFMKKYSALFKYFEIDESGRLSIELSKEEIKNISGFNDNEFSRFNDIMQINLEYNNIDESSKLSVSPYLHVKDWKVYFTYADVQMYLFAAAQIGPAAIVAALTALSTMVSPGIGTVLGVIVGVVGAADLCYLVLQAAVKHQGIYMGIDWNGIFPNYTQGTWNG